MPQKCQTDARNEARCTHVATDCIKWKSSSMSAPAFWYQCESCADRSEVYFSLEGRVEFVRTKLAQTDRTLTSDLVEDR